jgi:Bacteriodetes cell division protein (FtsL-like)
LKPVDEIKQQFTADSLVDNLPFLLFLAGLALVYIYNNHKAENTVREINKINSDLKELKWEYLEAKNDLENRSIQTKVAEAVAPMGLSELTTPPQKIVSTVKSASH